MRRERRPGAAPALMTLAVILTLVSACSSALRTTSTQTPSASSAAPSTAPFTLAPVVLRWSPCPAKLNLSGLECSRLKVPLDYAKPQGAQITLQLSRMRHDPSAGSSLGVMLSDPGGPGGSGLQMPFYGSQVPNNVGNRFDWVGWDPRGVGASTPALHCIPRYFGTDRPPYAAPQDRSYWLRQAASYAKACGRTGGPLLQHMTSADNARDISALLRSPEEPRGLRSRESLDPGRRE